MPTKKVRILSVSIAGGLVFAGVTTAAITPGHAPARTALAANLASSPPVNLDNCPILTEGYHGGCVNQLQTELNAANGTSIPVDGIFGSKTRDAVETFQENHHIVPVDGKVGPQTKAVLDNLGLNSAAAPTPEASAGSGAANTTQTSPTPPTSSQPGNPNPASAPVPEHCGTAEDTMNIMDPTLLGVPGPGAGSAHLSVYWCWDGSKITRLGNPEVWTTKTGNGRLLEWNTDTPVTIDKDPQNGGYWTRETVVTGTYHFCAVSYCLPTQPFKLDLYVFGDGVKYIANRVNVKASPL
jgi:peptidoglycan hydrolase-like protein with peptidoglycan-binding domain